MMRATYGRFSSSAATGIGAIWNLACMLRQDRRGARSSPPTTLRLTIATISSFVAVDGTEFRDHGRTGWSVVHKAEQQHLLKAAFDAC